LFVRRVLAFDYETLQFVADFKTTDKDPGALYFVSSRFHRFFLKNINPYEINTRIMRIGNVVQSLPSAQPPTYQFNPSYNSIAAQSPQQYQQYSQAMPTASASLFPYHHQQQQQQLAAPPTTAYQSYSVQPQVFPTAIAPPPNAAGVAPKPNGFSLYSYAQQYPAPTLQYPSPSPSSAPSPVHFPQSPVRIYRPRGQQQQQLALPPYAFVGIDKRNNNNNYPFQQLNFGETLPQSNSLVNLNFGGEVYRPNTRYVRHPASTSSLLRNATVYH